MRKLQVLPGIKPYPERRESTTLTLCVRSRVLLIREAHQASRSEYLKRSDKPLLKETMRKLHLLPGFKP